MAYALKVPGGLLSMYETAFVCPICERPDDGVEFSEALHKSKRGYVYKKCKGCKRKLFVCCHINGDLFVSEPHKI